MLLLTLYQMPFTLNSLPNAKSWYKAFAEDKIEVNENLNCGFRRIENIVGKGENAGYQHLLLSHSVFKTPVFQGC